jgi:hypothetical protein
LENGDLIAILNHIFGKWFDLILNHIFDDFWTPCIFQSLSAPPVIVISPPPTVVVDVSYTFVINCTAMGIPTPGITHW